MHGPSRMDRRLVPIGQCRGEQCSMLGTVPVTAPEADSVDIVGSVNVDETQRDCLSVLGCALLQATFDQDREEIRMGHA